MCTCIPKLPGSMPHSSLTTASSSGWEYLLLVLSHIAVSQRVGQGDTILRVEMAGLSTPVDAHCHCRQVWTLLCGGALASLCMEDKHSLDRSSIVPQQIGFWDT